MHIPKKNFIAVLKMKKQRMVALPSGYQNGECLSFFFLQQFCYFTMFTIITISSASWEGLP